jgi:hypothetical protein
LKSGNGYYKAANGDIYDGQFLNGLRNGVWIIWKKIYIYNFIN